MKRLLLILTLIISSLSLLACSPASPADNSNKTAGNNTVANNNAPAPPANAEQLTPPTAFQGKKVLVAFFSRTGENYEVGVIDKGNTHMVAEMIADAVKADKLFEIKPQKPYPHSYQETIELVKQENLANERPPLADTLPNMADYDIIFLGYPNWWSNFPPPVMTFFESYNFADKTIIPFCTASGDTMTGKEEYITTYARGSKVLKGIGIRGKRIHDEPDTVKADVRRWLNSLGYK